MKNQFSLCILSLALLSACQSTRGIGVWLEPSRALDSAPQAANAIEQFDFTAIMGNDFGQARLELDKALKNSPEQIGLLARSAYLHDLSMNHELWFRQTLKIIKLAPDSKASHYGLGQISRGLPDLMVFQDDILKVLEQALSKAKHPSTLAIASRLAFSLYQYQGNDDDAQTALSKGGWLFRGQLMGPVAPYLFHSLNQTPWLLQVEPLKPITIAGRRTAPESYTKLRSSLPLSQQKQAGLYVADSYFRLPEQGGAHEVDLQVQSRTRYRVSIDGKEVISRSNATPLRARYQITRLKISGGWHRVRVTALTSSKQSIGVSILDRHGRNIVTEHTAEAKDFPDGDQLEVIGAWPHAKSNLLADSFESQHSKFDHLIAALHALQPWHHDVDGARRLIRPIEKAAHNSGAYHIVAAELLKNEDGSGGNQLVHLRTALKLAPSCPKFLFQIAKRVLSEDPDEALKLADQMQLSGANPSKVELIRYSVYQKRDWLVDADRAYQKLLERWQANDILRSILNYFRERRYIAEAKDVETRLVNQAGKRVNRTKTNFSIYRGEDDLVKSAYIEAHKEDGHNKNDALRLANFYLRHKKPEQALALAKEVLSKSPDSRPAARVLISSLQTLQRKEELSQYLQKSRHLYSSSLDFESFLAQREGRLPGLPAQGSKLADLLKLDVAAIAKTPLERRWSNHGKVRLLDRHVDYLRKDGHVLSMTHFLTRITTKEASDQVGEIGLGQGVIPLELRTLKPNGQIVEVERHEGKKDLSYAALAPGDTIENQTVMINPPRTRHGGYQQIFYFQDTAPSLRGEFYLVVPKGTQVDSISYNGAPEAKIIEDGDHQIYLWKSPPVDGLIPEPFSVSSKEYIPFVVVSVGISAEEARLENGSVFDGAYESTYDIVHQAESLVEPSDRPREKLEKLFRWVLREIKDGNTFSPAESLKNKRGNRIGLLKLMLEAVDVDVDLVLARSVHSFILTPPYPDTKRHGILVLRVNTASGPVWVRTGSKLNWLGKVQPDFRGGTYIEVGDPKFEEKSFRPEDIANWEGRSSLKLHVDKENLGKGVLEIVLPAAVGQSLRNSLEGIPKKDRSKILSRWIGSIIRGFDATAFEFTTPKDPLLDPVLRITIVSRNLIQATGSRISIPRFFDNFLAIQMLGIPKLSEYIKLSERKTPLLFRGLNEEMLVEVSFEEPLSKVLRAPKSWERSSKWGTYKQSFEWLADQNMVRLRRSVEMPSTRVPINEYADFLDLGRELRLRTRNQLVLSRD